MAMQPLADHFVHLSGQQTEKNPVEQLEMFFVTHGETKPNTQN